MKQSTTHVMSKYLFENNLSVLENHVSIRIN